MPDKYDFGGYATRNDLKCNDGRVIKKNAFIANDGRKVPLVWNHQHNDTKNVLGHAILENREDGVYAYACFNDSPSGQNAKEMVKHGDIKSLSIYANKLKEIGNDVVHGMIREVSLVLAGANPGAFIDTVMVHGDDENSGLIIGYDEDIETPTVEIRHSDVTNFNQDQNELEMTHSEGSTKMAEKTIQDVVDTMTEDQKNAMYALIGLAIEENGGANSVQHNLFEDDEEVIGGVTLSHADLGVILGDAKKYGTLKESMLAHTQDYGIENVDYLFPDAKALDQTPQFISRRMEWVSKVIGGVRNTPFSRIKSIFADITEDEARAKGYIKGNRKTEEVFSLLKRETTPTTIYKKQKMDRDDILDITDFDVVVWLKSEMRIMLDEEIARAILIGDGRLASSNDKISETNIRPIWKDDSLYSVKVISEIPAGATSTATADQFITAAIKNRKHYKGSGNPTLFTTEDIITDCLLIKDTTGRRIYNTVSDLATALRVSDIVTVEAMEGTTRVEYAKTYTLTAIMVNLTDYTIGADKGGAVGMFDDFDIDYNQFKYLIETRCSGALTRPFSALVFESTPKVSG